MTPLAGIPIRELFSPFGHRDFDRKAFAVFTAYIDDSGSRESNLFTLSCLVGWGSEWFWFEQAWVKLLEETNASLRAQNRTLLTRYHAADCSSCLNEFKGWSRSEQIAFTQKIISIFRRHHMITISYTINLAAVKKEIPETRKNTLRFAHLILLNHMMIEIGKRITKRKEFRPNDRIALIHDRCAYNAAMLEMFDFARADPTFECGKFFTTIAPMSWQDCVPLQPADLLAYENFKEVERQTSPRRRRKTLEFLLDLRTFGGLGASLGTEWIKEFKKLIRDWSPATRRFFFPHLRKRTKKRGAKEKR